MRMRNLPFGVGLVGACTSVPIPGPYSAPYARLAAQMVIVGGHPIRYAQEVA